MKHSMLIIIGIVTIVALAGAMLWQADIAHAPQTEQTQAQTAQGYKNATYDFDGRPVTLVDGKAETEAAPGSASKITTQYFGNEAIGDLNNDGIPDIAFLLTQQGDGSGTFFYVVAALKTQNGWQGTNAILLGDRIAPQTTQIANGEITVNYANRNPGEPMTAKPSMGAGRHFTVQNNILTEVKTH